MKTQTQIEIAEQLEKLGFSLTGIPFAYLILRLGFGGVLWLAEGFWREITPCSVLNVLCAGKVTGLVGFDQIIVWFGTSDFIFSLLLLIPLGIYIAIKSSNWKSFLEKKLSK